MQAITFTNYGYIKYTLNLLKSVEVNNVNLQIKIFCTDQKSYNFFKNKNYYAELLVPEEPTIEKFTTWKAGVSDFGIMMLNKFVSIHKTLLEYEHVLYIDGDIVVKENFNDYLIQEINNYDFLFQLDYNPKREIQNEACAGFMLIKSNKETIELFDLKKINKEELVNLPSHDQTYINLNKDKFKYRFLSPSNFPNGAYFSKFETDPKIIHFNYFVGQNKIKTMRKYKQWYL